MNVSEHPGLANALTLPEYSIRISFRQNHLQELLLDLALDKKKKIVANTLGDVYGKSTGPTVILQEVNNQSDQFHSSDLFGIYYFLLICTIFAFLYITVKNFAFCF